MRRKAQSNGLEDEESFVPRSLDGNVRRGIYTVVCALPVAGRGCQYRVRHADYEHERVIDEAQLRSVASLPPVSS